MMEFSQYIREARDVMGNLGVLEELQDVSSSAIYRAAVADRLPWLDLPYTVDGDDVIALFRSDYLPGFRGSGPVRTWNIFTSSVDVRDFGDFFLGLASQDDVAHVLAFTHEVPTRASTPTTPVLQFAARFPLSRAAEFFEELAEALWRPHSKRAMLLDESLTSLAARMASDCRRPRVEVCNVTLDLLRLLERRPEELSQIDPEMFEALVADRLRSMGMGVQRVGKTNRKDGGVDIVAWPERLLTVPFLLAVQVKHRSTGKPVGPGPVRDLQGVLSRLPCEVGMLVTNTEFTADARWVANQRPTLVRLRDFADVMRWIRGDFLGEMAWQEIPEAIELAPGIMVKIPKWRFFVSQGNKEPTEGGT